MEFSKKTKEYWQKEDWKDLEKADFINDLYIIAKRIINRIPKPLIQVCGPITTGGVGSIEENLDLLNKNIIQLQEKGLNVFDQMPFEIPMHKINKKLAKNGEYLNSILTDFYLPIFESRVISTLYFLPNWQTSLGASWEHEKAKELGINIVYL